MIERVPPAIGRVDHCKRGSKRDTYQVCSPRIITGGRSKSRTAVSTHGLSISSIHYCDTFIVREQLCVYLDQQICRCRAPLCKPVATAKYHQFPNYYFQTCFTKSSKSSFRTSGLSKAAKCPPYTSPHVSEPILSYHLLNMYLTYLIVLPPKHKISRRFHPPPRHWRNFHRKPTHSHWLLHKPFRILVRTHHSRCEELSIRIDTRRESVSQPVQTHTLQNRLQGRRIIRPIEELLADPS